MNDQTPAPQAARHISEPPTFPLDPPVKLYDLLAAIVVPVILALGAPLLEVGSKSHIPVSDSIAFSLALAMLSSTTLTIVVVHRARVDINNYNRLISDRDQQVRLNEQLNSTNLTLTNTITETRDLLSQRISDLEQHSVANIKILHHQYSNIAENFKKLNESRIAFDAEVAVVVAENIRNQRFSLTNMQQLQECFHDTLQDITTRAVHIISQAHGEDEPECVCNIKAIDPDNCYFVFKSSPNRTDSRKAYDELLLLSDHKRAITDNAVYSYLMDISEDDDKIIPDIDEFIHALNTRKFKEPSLAASELYKSCLVVPIKGPPMAAWAADDLAVRPHFQLLRKEYVLGFLCLDSPKKGFFNKEYDLKVANQLALEVYSIMCVYFSMIMTSTSITGV